MDITIYAWSFILYIFHEIHAHISKRKYSKIVIHSISNNLGAQTVSLFLYFNLKFLVPLHVRKLIFTLLALYLHQWQGLPSSSKSFQLYILSKFYKSNFQIWNYKRILWKNKHKCLTKFCRNFLKQGFYHKKMDLKKYLPDFYEKLFNHINAVFRAKWTFWVFI